MAKDAITYTKLYDSALRSLTRRDHSQVELRDKLARKHRVDVLMPVDDWAGEDGSAQRLTIDDALDQLVEDLEKQGLLSDLRFAEAVVRSRFSKGYGPIYIRQDLRRKGVDEDSIDSALATQAADWQDQADQQVTRRFPMSDTDRSVWMKAARFLQRRGFTSDQIRHALGRMPPADVAT